mmetsp:Transcript_24131/g.95055  ORF Transcript_24131/g.95055 Transcript_24131/m.95055 type:complete len:102 (+) Transcript_24131:50-355(+)
MFFAHTTLLLYVAFQMSDDAEDFQPVYEEVDEEIEDDGDEPPAEKPPMKRKREENDDDEEDADDVVEVDGDNPMPESKASKTTNDAGNEVVEQEGESQKDV